MQKVKIAGKEYGIKCNIGVLIEIQERFGNILNFELKLVGYEPVRNEDGTVKLGEDKTPLMVLKQPSLAVIYEILPFMLRAGAEEGQEVPELSDEALEFDIKKTADSMYEAYNECYRRKNLQPARGRKAGMKK